MIIHSFLHVIQLFMGHFWYQLNSLIWKIKTFWLFRSDPLSFTPTHTMQVISPLSWSNSVWQLNTLQPLIQEVSFYYLNFLPKFSDCHAWTSKDGHYLEFVIYFVCVCMCGLTYDLVHLNQLVPSTHWHNVTIITLNVQNWKCLIQILSVYIHFALILLRNTSIPSLSKQWIKQDRLAL